MTYKGVAKGKIIELEESLPYSEGQAVSVSVETLHPPSTRVGADDPQGDAEFARS